MIKKTYYKWRQFEEDCESLAKEIKDDEFNFEGFVAITRGGLFIAGLLSQFFEPTVIETVCISSYKDKEKQHFDILKKAGSNKEMLICDDIVDTGDTLLRVKEMYPNSRSVVLHYKAENNSKVEPDYFVRKTNDWIVYPWEVNDK